MKLRNILLLVILVAVVIGSSGGLTILGGEYGCSQYKPWDPKNPPGSAITQDYG